MLDNLIFWTPESQSREYLKIDSEGLFLYEKYKNYNKEYKYKIVNNDSLKEILSNLKGYKGKNCSKLIKKWKLEKKIIEIDNY